MLIVIIRVFLDQMLSLIDLFGIQMFPSLLVSLSSIQQKIK